MFSVAGHETNRRKRGKLKRACRDATGPWQALPTGATSQVAMTPRMIGARKLQHCILLPQTCPGLGQSLTWGGQMSVREFKNLAGGGCCCIVHCPGARGVGPGSQDALEKSPGKSWPMADVGSDGCLGHPSEM